MNKNVLSILIFALVGIAASTIIPWVKIDAFGQNQSVLGTAGDGYLTAGLLVVPLLLSILNLKSDGLGTGVFIGILIPSLIASGIGAYDIYNLTDKMPGISLNPFGEGIVIGSGLYLLVLSGLFITIRSFGARNKA